MSLFNTTIILYVFGLGSVISFSSLDTKLFHVSRLFLRTVFFAMAQHRLYSIWSSKVPVDKYFLKASLLSIII
jgi:hypothetical protein